MALTNGEKETIVTRARTLNDRLDTSVSETSIELNEDTDWLAEWRDRVADGDETVFHHRLEHVGLSPETCQRRLQNRGWPETESLPAWVEHVDDLLEYIKTNYANDPPNPIADDEVPFSAIFTAVVKYASEQVDWSLVSDQAVEEFEYLLVDRLRSRFAHPLFIEFKVYLAEHDKQLALADDPEMPDQPRQYYDAFVEDFLAGDLESFFVEYGALSKFLVVTIQQWVAATEEFLARFKTDRSALAETFGQGNDVGAITDVESLGDAHQGGKTVLKIVFESGIIVAYKPRSLDIDVAFHDFLSWVNDQTDFPDFRSLTCLARDGYGWQEWVEAKSCESTAGVTRYYRRAGALVALLYALKFTDGHLENIIAYGDQPMVVDLETLFAPDLPPEKNIKVSPDSTVPEKVQNTVIQTGILPVHLPNRDIQNAGGLGAVEGKATGIEIPEFENVNTDVMDLTYRETSTISGESLPRIDGEQFKPESYPDAIEDGFEWAYRFLLSNKNELLAADGPLATFEDIENRVLYRSTQVYGKTLVPFTTPSYLRSGLQCSCKVESLAQPFAEERVDEHMWGVFEAERDALLQFDIPRFTANTSKRDLFHDDRTIADVFETTPLEQDYNHIESLSEADLREQLTYVTLAYDPKRLAYPERPGPSDIGTEWDASDSELAVQTAHDIFDRIHDHSFKNGNDEPMWYLRDERDSGVNLHRINDDLYEGRIGIALFSGALARYSDDERHRNLATDIASALEDKLDDDEPFEDDRIGAGHGLGSILYGFVKLAELLDEDKYLGTAREIATLLTTERIENDDGYDTMNGSAGTILSLLALYNSTGDEDVLDQAVTAGEHLLADRVEVDGIRTWNTVDPNDRPLLGMSHGVAGIGYALYQLGETIGERRFCEAATEAFEYEREQYVPEEHNWPDLRTSNDLDFSAGWCSGRSGIGLSRLELFDLTGETSFRNEADDALRGMDPNMLLDRDHLCCGNLGRSEFLLRAARTLDDSTYRDQAVNIALEAVQQAEQNGRFISPWQTEDWYNPTYFTGEAGIGYSLLRLAHPELPCVLLWE